MTTLFAVTLLRYRRCPPPVARCPVGTLLLDVALFRPRSPVTNRPSVSVRPFPSFFLSFFWCVDGVIMCVRLVPGCVALTTTGPLRQKRRRQHVVLAPTLVQRVRLHRHPALGARQSERPRPQRGARAAQVSRQHAVLQGPEGRGHGPWSLSNSSIWPSPNDGQFKHFGFRIEIHRKNRLLRTKYHPPPSKRHLANLKIIWSLHYQSSGTGGPLPCCSHPPC